MFLKIHVSKLQSMKNQCQQNNRNKQSTKHRCVLFPVNKLILAYSPNQAQERQLSTNPQTTNYMIQ